MRRDITAASGSPILLSSVTKLINVRRVLIALSAAFALGVIGLMAFQINRSRDETIGEGYREALNLANALAEQTHQSFSSVDLMLQSFTAPELRRVLLDPAARDRARLILRSRGRVLQGAVGIFIIGADGRLLLSSSDSQEPPVDMSDRPEFQQTREDRNSGLIISRPRNIAAGAADRDLVIVLARRLEDEGGRFLGLAEVVMPLEHFAVLYAHLNIGPHGVIGILRRDGVVLTRYPLGAKDAGESGAGQTNGANAASEHDSDTLIRYTQDRIQRITAYREVPDVDLLAAVSVAVPDILAPWKRNAIIQSVAAGALIALIGLLAFVSARLLRRSESERESTVARLNLLAEVSAEIAAFHHGAALAHGIRRAAQKLLPGSIANVRFGLERTGAALAPSADSRRIITPLSTKDGRVLGYVEVRRETGQALTRQDAAFIAQLAQIASAALENVDLLAQSRRFAEQAERARLEEAEARRAIEDVFATMSEGVYTLDGDDRFTFVNENAQRLLGRRRDQLVGRVIWDVLPQASGSGLHEEFARCMVEQEPLEREHEFETAAGVRWLEIRLFPSPDALTVYFRDITQRIETEGKLRQAQKMEAIGQLTGGIAHDFNNLLTVVLGNIDILVETLDDNLRKVAESARDAALRGATLVARLLAFARRQALAPRAVDVNQLITGLEELLRRAIGTTIQFKFVRDPDLWKASVDPAQMENAILNLALNARDAMASGGILTIETANIHLDMDTAGEAPVAAGDYVMVSVSDTGTGMTAEVRDRAFDPFFTTKGVGQGSGLGLSMVYGFVRQSGGHVRIYSEVGHGTTVRMFLLSAPESVDMAGAASRGGDAPLGRETVLLVEDDELVREHLSETLKGLGYTVVPCATGHEAIDMIQGDARVDLLVTDLVLAGGINGQSVADRIVAMKPGLPVLFMSGYTETSILESGRLERPVHFIGKPFRRDEIARKLREALAEARHHDAAVVEGAIL